MSNIAPIKKDSSIPALAINESELMDVLRNSLYPGAQDNSIKMVIAYCKASGLDPMRKPVHIVPMWDSKTKSMRDVIMPGIGSYRSDAAKSGQYAGVSVAEFGPEITENIGGVEITYPQWCRVVVRRQLTNGQIAEFAATERWKENYAVKGGQEKSIAPNAMWQKRPYAQLEKCFDEETEVLTTKGFEKFSEVTGNVIQVTEHGISATDSKPFAQDYSGEMIVADGTRLNFSVTPNHDMITSLGKMEASKLYEVATKDTLKVSIPRSPNNTNNDACYSDSAIQLAGFFLADGYHSHNQFRIAVSREYKIDILREIALHKHESIKKDAGRVSKIGEREIVTNSDKVQFTYDFSIISGIVNADKSVNADALLSLSSRQASILVDSVLMFDGSDNGNGVRRLCQKNKNVIQSFELAAILAGYSVSKNIRERTGGTVDITISESTNFPVVKGVDKIKSSLVKRKNVSGRVWCVTVPSGVIVVRRKGFSMLCGNCAEAQALRKAFPEVGSQPTADEMEGKPIYEGGAVIDNATGEILNKEQPKPAEKPLYSDESFQKNKAAWRDLVISGKKTPEAIIKAVESKAVMTEEQRFEIDSWTREQD